MHKSKNFINSLIGKQEKRKCKQFFEFGVEELKVQMLKKLIKNQPPNLFLAGSEGEQDKSMIVERRQQRETNHQTLSNVMFRRNGFLLLILV